MSLRPLHSLFLITHPPPLETSTSQTSYLIIHVCRTHSHTILEVWGETTCALFTAHNVFGSLLRFVASMVYTCSTLSVLSKTMLFLSATLVQGGYGVGNAFYLNFTRFTQMQCRKCCNNCFDMYKLLMSNDNDRRILEHLLW